MTHLPAGLRSIWCKEALLMERLPALLATFFATLQAIKSTNPQLMRPEDKRRLQWIVQVNSAEGINLRQVKIADSATYKYVLDPPIDVLIHSSANSNGTATISHFSDPCTVQDSHSYALCRLIGTEMETQRIRTTIKPSTTKTETKKRPSSSSIASEIPAGKKIARDFFGRPIVEVKEAPANTNANANDDEALPIAEFKIWYSQNDGVSNAVRRNIKIRSFF